VRRPQRQSRVLRDADWQAAIRQVFKARAFVFAASGSRRPTTRSGRRPDRIRLHMGLAFGTASTRRPRCVSTGSTLMVRAGATVLDYGCAPVCSRSRRWRSARATPGPRTTTAGARSNTFERALNGAAERLAIAAPEALPAVTVDIVAANILAGPLIALAPRLAAHVRPGGALVLAASCRRKLRR